MNKIINCKCGELPKEIVSEMFPDCSNNYHIECPKCGNRSIISNFSYYNSSIRQETDKKEAVDNWNKKQ